MLNFMGHSQGRTNVRKRAARRKKAERLARVGSNKKEAKSQQAAKKESETSSATG
jgi:hypothetical protein